MSRPAPRRRCGSVSWRTCVCVSVILMCGVVPVSAAARPKPITGALDKPGYTVIALAANGSARSVRARTGGFRVVPPATRVTLQLRSPQGKYAGPIVVGGASTKVIVGVRAGARLGRIVVGAGHARVARRQRSAAIDRSRWARARRGVPVGAGVFGRVRTTPPRHAPPGDRDADGIPDVIDIDDDGDRIIDNVDRSKTARAAQSTSQLPHQWIKSFLGRALFQTANADVPALSDRITSAFKGLTLMIGIAQGDAVELDCGGSNQTPPRPEGLSYCSRGGTGTTADPRQLAFPDAFDPDGNGMGNLTPSPTRPSTGNDAFFLGPNAAPDQIGTGDTLIQRVTNKDGGQTQVTDTVQYLFTTVPTLVAYDDGQGDAGTVDYPVAYGAPGNLDNGFPVKARPDGRVSVRLTFWRPQRPPIPPETAPWMDIGHLTYGMQIYSTGLACPDDAFSDPVAPLAAAPTAYAFGGGALSDQAGDRPADPANTLTFTIDLTTCLAAHGRSFPVGGTQGFDLSAMTCGGERCTAAGQSSGPDQAVQTVSFTRR